MSDTKELDFTGDEYWGIGGSYIVDPATGKRSPRPFVAEAPAPKEQPTGAETAAAPARRPFGRGTTAPAGGDSA